MSEERKICPDCGLPRPDNRWDSEDEFCFATGTVNHCQPKTIARFRSELAAVDRALGIPDGEERRRIERLIVLRAEINAYRETSSEAWANRRALQISAAERAARDAIVQQAIREYHASKPVAGDSPMRRAVVALLALVEAERGPVVW